LAKCFSENNANIVVNYYHDTRTEENLFKKLSDGYGDHMLIKADVIR